MMYRTLNKPSSCWGGDIWSVFNYNWSALQSYLAVCRDIHIRRTLRTFTYIDMENRLDSFPDVHTGKTFFSLQGSGKTSDHLQVFLPAWISQIATVTDSAESFGEHMQKETADKLFPIKQHGFFFSVIVDTGTDQNAVVRCGAGKAFEQIDSLPNGTNCYMTGRFKEADGRTWAEIDYPVEGWIAASILGYWKEALASGSPPSHRK